LSGIEEEDIMAGFVLSSVGKFICRKTYSIATGCLDK
jgi:hypothetical protein